MEGWGKVKQAAKYANTTPKTFRTWFKKGLKFSRPNSRVTLVKYSDIDEFLQSHSIDEDEAKMIDQMADSIIREFRNKN
ncbi:MAG: helix-turn-helix domain-containing protein [Proteobacteria bacterium]|nr:helix-turn-helix domain-containing protein [Pseudomonadota bacterium]